ncbi:hypothetical protein EC991_006575 [Linnemannia zychae]|nr:hypothetical protein EC991_006575 [Linnemannia zychae]
MIMLTCPPSVEILEGFNYSQDPLLLFDLDDYNRMELDEEGPLESRQGPLYSLKRLKLPWNMGGYTPETFLSMLKICPNVEAIDIPLVTGDIPGGMGAVAKAFKDLCPCVQELSAERIYFDHHGLGILPLMEEIEPNTLQRWSMGSYSDSWKTRTLDVIRRHSETLREIRFPSTYSFKSSTIQGILTTCRALEHLDIGGDIASRLKLWLDDIEPDTPWVSTRLRYLKLTVDWNDKQDKPNPPKPKQEPSVRMSLRLINDRMNAILASRMRLTIPSEQAKPDGSEEFAGIMAREANERRWTRLERFYKQLGTLTNLEVLDLRGTSGFPEEEPTNQLRPYTEYTLPRLLSLANDDKSTALMDQGTVKLERRGKKVGYLSELGGLTKLRELRGSFRIDRPTVKMYLGQREVEFMHQHWPELRLIELLPPDYETRRDFVIQSHMRWFMEQRPFTKMTIPAPTTAQ